MFTIGVENGHFYPKSEGPTLKPSSPRLGTCQDQNSCTLAHQAVFKNTFMELNWHIELQRLSGVHVYRNRVTKTKYKPEALRMNGSCPLTPEEIGLLLSGLGFTNNTPAYMAMKVTTLGMIAPYWLVFAFIVTLWVLVCT